MYYYLLSKIPNNMNNFTNFKNFTAINEAVKRASIEVLTVEDINQYAHAVKKMIPSQVADIIYLTAKYSLCDQKSIDDIKACNKGQLGKISAKFNIPMNEISKKQYPTTPSIPDSIRKKGIYGG